MVFSGISFLYLFLPISLAFYHAAPRKAKNAVLLISSVVFYFYGEQMYVLVMAAETVFSYLLALLIHKCRGRKTARVFLCAAVSFCLLPLGFFKYAGFFAETVNAVFGTAFSPALAALPLGISFYTFQNIGYLVDVYRGRTSPSRDPVAFSTYISMFPQLVAGPIVRYTDVENSLRKRAFSASKFADGVLGFAFGLAKKVIIADRLYEFCGAFTASADKSVAFCWAYAAAFSMYVYFDFSGYSDMAVGLGKMFGFDLPKNFDYPLTSRSVGEFWRRWHITLGDWFRDYVYIPLGGNRVSPWRTALNLFVVWILTGLWHGASLNFVLWGAYFGALVVSEKLFFKKALDRLPRVFSHAYLVTAVMVGFVIFGAENVLSAFGTLSAMFGAGGLPLWSAETGYYLGSFMTVLVFAALFSTPFPSAVVRKMCENKAAKSALSLLEPAAVAVTLTVVTAYFADSSFSPFLYFRF